MAALCKAPTKSTGICLSITAVYKNAEKKTLGQDDFFVVSYASGIRLRISNCHGHFEFQLGCQMLILRYCFTMLNVDINLELFQVLKV